MAKAGAPLGNQNGIKNPWRTALESVVSKSPLKLRQVAETLVDAAIAGDIQAIKELGDRLDGKPKQSIEADISLSPGAEFVELLRQLSSGKKE